MKNTVRFGIALLALIVFSMTACDNGLIDNEGDEEKPDVISVTVLPGSDRVHRGYQLTFIALVTGTVNKTVTWSIEQGNRHAGTTIGPNNGLLTVSPDEELTELTVKAVLMEDETIFNEATVSVPVPTITGVEISLHDGLAIFPWNPSSKVMDIKSGTTERFKAKIVGANFPKQDVTWSIVGTQSGISINQSGELTVSPDKPQGSTFTIRAASSIDDTKSDTITVTVQPPTINRVTIVPSPPQLGTSYTYMDEITFTPTYYGSGRITEFPAPADLSWGVGRADGQPISEEQELEVWDEENQTTTTDTIPPTQFDGDVLKVSFFEKEGNLWVALTVTLDAGRTITSPPVTISFMNILSPN